MFPQGVTRPKSTAPSKQARLGLVRADMGSSHAAASDIMNLRVVGHPCPSHEYPAGTGRFPRRARRPRHIFPLSSSFGAVPRFRHAACTRGYFRCASTGQFSCKRPALQRLRHPRRRFMTQNIRFDARRRHLDIISPWPEDRMRVRRERQEAASALELQKVCPPR